MLEIRKINCISYTKEDEMYDTRKAVIGDIVRLFYNSTRKGCIDGEILDIDTTEKSVIVLASDGYKHKIKLSEFRGCDIISRGSYFRSISGIH